MAVIRWREGAVSASITMDQQVFLRAAVSKITGGLLEALEAEAEKVAAHARQEWYGPNGVREVTGKSGDIQVVTTVSEHEVRVSVGSTDTRRVQTKRRDGREFAGKPVVVYVHRPGPLAMRRVEVTRERWFRALRDGRRVFRAPLEGEGSDDAGRGWFLLESDPRANDGKFLLTELVRKPVLAWRKRFPPEITRSLAARLLVTHGG